MIQSERIKELDMSKSLRWLVVAQNGIVGLTNLPSMLSALAVFTACSIQANIRREPPLSTALSFTSLALMVLLTSPLVALLQSKGTIAAQVANLHGIQAFLSTRHSDG